MKKRITIYIDSEVYKEAKKICVDKETNISREIEKLLKELIEKRKGE